MAINELLDQKSMDRTLKRIAHEILEKNRSMEDVILVGIKTRGEHLAKRLQSKIEDIEGVNVPVEILDITFYRDDLSKKSQDPQVKRVEWKHNLNDKKVVVIDDVLYTGRTVRAAMDAILDSSRPSHIQLAVMVDRGHRELPIRADFVGKNIPTSKQERVQVQISEIDHQDQIIVQS